MEILFKSSQKCNTNLPTFALCKKVNCLQIKYDVLELSPVLKYS